MRKIASVIGLGYMGLPTTCLLAKSGFRVIGVDIDARKIAGLKRGQIPFEEDGLDKLFVEAVRRLDFSVKPLPADVFIVSVPTPMRCDKSIDNSFVEAAVGSLVPVLKNGDLVILESTIAPMVSEKVVKKILDRSKKKYLLAHCPERAFPGNTLKEMVENDRIVGGLNKKSAEAAKKIYSSFVKGNIYTTDIRTAEVVKLMENSYRGVNIAFANEMAKLAHSLGINVWEAIELANHHPRVKILSPGPGVGGHCIPIDPWFLVKGPGGANLRALNEALETNEKMPAFVVGLAEKTMRDNNMSVKKVGILGMSYKKNVDDTRESPALIIGQILKKRGYLVRFADYFVKSSGVYKEEEVLKWADALIVATNHDRYRRIDFSRSKPRLVVDARNCLTPTQVRQLRLRGAMVVTLGNGNERDA